MAMGKRAAETQSELFITHEHLPRSQGHPFYEALNRVLRDRGFDNHVEQLCQKFYAPVMGRPSLAPGLYFRALLVGKFEGLSSERGIAWRLADSLSLRQFLGLPCTENPPDHSTLSRTRRLIDLETHQQVFDWVLTALAQEGLVKGKTIGIDATTLEANAALRSIVHNHTEQSYREYLTELAKASGIETPTHEDLARLDRKRKNKGSNDDWHHPHDPDAKITKMKDGSTHLAHKNENAVDMDTGAVVAVTVQAADEGDTTTWRETFERAADNLNDVRKDPQAAAQMSEAIAEVVTDKGYHSNQTMTDFEEIEVRSYVSEPQRGRRNWEGKDAEQQAVYANRRRVKGKRGKRLMRKRGELLERPFAHTLETGGMRRVFLRGARNIQKRLLIHVAGFNLSLLMRKLYGVGTPRSLQDRLATALATIFAAFSTWGSVLRGRQSDNRSRRMFGDRSVTWRAFNLAA